MTQRGVTATISPLDLPEIRLVLADVLSLHALTVCARVSKDWNRSFMPLLWRYVSLRVEVIEESPSPTEVTTLELAIKHKGFIKSLTIHDINGWSVSQRKELWSVVPEFPILRSLRLLMTIPDFTTLNLLKLMGAGNLQTIVSPESIQLLKPRFSNLHCLDFHPCTTLESESYEEILSGCPQLQTLRGGNVKAKVLTEGRPWVCTLLRHWSLCLDFGAIGDYRGKIIDTTAADEPSDSTSPSLLEMEAEQPVAQMRREVRHQLLERMSHLAELETIDFRQANMATISARFQIGPNDSNLERLLRCPRLREFKYDWDESESEIYCWIGTHWQGIELNSFPDEEYESGDEYGSGDEYDIEVEDERQMYADMADLDEYDYRLGHQFRHSHDYMYDSEDSEHYNSNIYGYR